MAASSAAYAMAVFEERGEEALALTGEVLEEGA